MNKGQLIETLASHFEGNKRAAQHALESVVSTITREVARGEKVAITGFGAFEKAIRPARMVRNPRTGERSRAKKTAVPKFRPGADLKAVVSGAKKAPKAGSTGGQSASAKSASASRPAKKSSTARKSSVGTAKKASAAGRVGKRPATKKGTSKSTTAKRSSAAKKSS